MDARDNPYTPNAGARPPALVGRDDQLEAFDVLLYRLLRGNPEQSMLVTGLRGVGKTVLLGAFEERARTQGWTTVDSEMTKQTDFASRIGQLVRRALFQVAPRERWKDRARRSAGVLRSFQLTVAPDGSITAGLDQPRVEGMADSGNLGDDLTDLVVSLGEAAEEQATGVVLLLDEIQFLDRGELEALVAAVHKTVQRRLPITLVGAGLPQLPRLVGEAKSYAERLFAFPVIGALDPVEAATALTEPAAPLGLEYRTEAVQRMVELTEGYPYFIQEFGKAVWDLASNDPVDVEQIERARQIVDAKLDAGFFRVRVERTTALELDYLRAMAELGPEAHQARAVADMLGRTSAQLGPTRSRLIEKGLLYTPGYGLAAFTVPQFDRFLRRSYPPPMSGRKATGRP